MFCDQCFCQLYTGIKEQSIENEKLVTLFPNPSREKVTIRINEACNSICKLEIFDLVGKKQTGKTINFKYEAEIEIGDLKTGLYLIKVYNKENEIIEIEKLIIE